MKIAAIAVFSFFVVLSSAAYLSVARSEGATSSQLVRFQLDAGKSEFIVHAKRGGLLWFKGHDHRVTVGSFTGEAALTTDVLNPASLSMTIDASSLEETHPTIPDNHKKIINQELDEIVLESSKYPEITFKSTEITGGLKNGAFDVKVAGDITLHGVTKRIVIPATVTLEGGGFRAKGKFELDRSDFKIKTPSAARGTVKVRDTLKFDFDIVGARQ